MDIPKINSRLRQIVDYKANGSVNNFAKKIKISQQKVNRLFNIDTRTNKYPSIPIDIIIAITEMYVDINIEWLLVGNGGIQKKGIIKEKTVITEESNCRELTIVNKFLKEQNENLKKIIKSNDDLIAILKEEKPIKKTSKFV